VSLKCGITLIIACALLAGCVTSRVEQNRVASTGIASGEAVVLLGRANYNHKETDVSFIECLENQLTAASVRVVNQTKFKDNLYPWFDSRQAPMNVQQLGELFARPGIKERISDSHIRYMAYIEGDTITIDKGGSLTCALGGGCFGWVHWEENASYAATIWDLQTMTSAGQISVDATGTSYVAGLVIPIPVIARPGKAACKDLASQLTEFIIN